MFAPQPQPENRLVWAIPKSLVATAGISLISFPAGTEIFQFPAFALLDYEFI
jgi:hypothetical protein